MKDFLEGVVRRRGELVEQSAAQRGAIVARVTEIRNASAAPAIVGVGVATTLLASSPGLRSWAIRGWAIYSFVRQLLAR